MNKLNFTITIMSLLTMILGCVGMDSKPKPEWTQSRKIAGREQKFSHVSGIVVDDKFAYVTMGGTIADMNEGTNGLRKIALDTGAVTVLDNDRKHTPQSETDGFAADEKYVYWNTGGSLMRIAKDGGAAETVVSAEVGVGVDLAIDNEKIYWANHYYYSSKNPAQPSPIFMAAKQGGKAEIFVDGQDVPGNIVVDEKYVYWRAASGLFKQSKASGQPQQILQLDDREGVDELAQDAENLYFTFRAAGSSYWVLHKISKNGGERQMLAKTYGVSGLVVDDANVYFIDEDSASPHALFKVPKNGGAVVRLDGGYSGGTIAQSKTQIYLASLDDIYSFAK